MRPPDILYILLLYLAEADALRVIMSKPLIGALREDNVTIPCDISDVGAGRTITVYWTRTWHGNRQEVYHYAPRETVFRAGAYMVESEIYRGNAELHLPRVQFSDEGDYTCTVIVTPNSVNGKATLQVSAPPSVSLTPGVISILLGTERSVMCEATNFYPLPVTIRWVRHNKGSPGCVVLDRGICTTDPVTNGDGTLNVTSHLTLHPTTMGDDGNKYSCIVDHRALESELRINFTLTVTEQKDTTGAVVGAVAVTLISTLLLVSAGLLYYKRFKKDPPSLSDISGNEEMIDMTRTTLTCQITGFRPNDIEISVRLKQGETIIVLDTWRSRDPVPPDRVTRDDITGGEGVAIEVEERQGLINGADKQEERPLQLVLVPVIKTSRLGVSSCHCSIHITPSFAEHNGAVLSVQVAHPALRSPISVRRTLNVIGVAPKLLTIMAPERLIHDETVTLTCPINGFRPRALSVTWVRRDQNRETELVKWDGAGARILDSRYSHNVQETEHDDKSYSCISALRFKPKVTEDQGVTFICRTHHPATGQTVERELEMVVTAHPVLDTIQRTQKTLSIGDQMELSCRIHSFSPAQITVIWYTEDDNVIPSHTSNALPEPNGLFYVTSNMKFHPTIKDMGKRFRCDVHHASLVEPRSIAYTLCDLMSEPSISEITCDPIFPEIGKPVTLSCMVTNMFPKEFEARWRLRGESVTYGDWKDNIQPDQKSGMFSGTLELPLTPIAEHHMAKFQLEVILRHKTVKRTYVMNLKGILKLSKITSDPDKPSYGKPLTLRCTVTGCKHEDIIVEWLENNKPLERPWGTATCVVEKDAISCTLNIIPTAQDYRRLFVCSVKHNDFPEAFRENICLTLPDNPPSLSDIIAQPAKPKAGKEVSLTTIISGFSPKDIQVLWYKRTSKFPGSAVTSSDLWIGKDGLYTCSSTLRFTPEQSDHNTTIRCEVTHMDTKTIREKCYDLCLAGLPGPVDEGRNSSQSPRADSKYFTIRGIECLTENPQVGDDVTLRCNVGGCNAEDCEFSWYNGAFPIEGKRENGDLEDGSGSFSTVTFTAEESDRSCTIRCEACYNYQTIEETFALRLVEQGKI